MVDRDDIGVNRAGQGRVDSGAGSEQVERDRAGRVVAARERGRVGQYAGGAGQDDAAARDVAVGVDAVEDVVEAARLCLVAAVEEAGRRREVAVHRREDLRDGERGPVGDAESRPIAADVVGGVVPAAGADDEAVLGGQAIVDERLPTQGGGVGIDAQGDREGLDVGVLDEAAGRPEVQIHRGDLGVGQPGQAGPRVRVRGAEQVRVVARQPVAQELGTGRAVEAVDNGLAILVVPEADGGELAGHHAAAGTRDHAWGGVDRGGGRADGFRLVAKGAGVRGVVGVAAVDRHPLVRARLRRHGDSRSSCRCWCCTCCRH